MASISEADLSTKETNISFQKETQTIDLSKQIQRLKDATTKFYKPHFAFLDNYFHSWKTGENMKIISKFASVCFSGRPLEISQQIITKWKDLIIKKE